MKIKNFTCGIISLFLLAGCQGNANQENVSEEPVAPARTVTTEEVKDKSFDELFKKIEPNQIPGNVFDLVGKDFTVITAGNTGRYNSMVASWGGWGILFNKPVTWCSLRANRYTLEFIREHKIYTMAYFDDNFKDDIMRFGTVSGRDSNKMQESALTSVETPAGSMAYKEAKLIIECSLAEVTTVSPDDFYEESSRDFVIEGYQDAGEYHKLVFGNITGVWVRK